MKTIRMVRVAFGITLGIGCLCATTAKGHRYMTKLDTVDLAIRVYWGQRQHATDDGWGTYPASLDELAEFAYTHLDLGKPLLKEGDLLDAWDQPFKYETDGRNWYFIQSSGPDKVMWTADDRFKGNRSVHLDEARLKAEQTPAVTNAAQKATSPSLLKRWLGMRGGAVPPLNREGGQDNGQSKTSLWRYALIPFCLLGAFAAWRYFRKRRRE